MSLPDFKDHFSNVTGRYSEFRPQYPSELFQWLASLPSRHDCAWDCATGNGQAATQLASFFREVIATDASAGQIIHSCPHSRIRYQVVPAENSGLPAASVDLVTVAQGAHWFDLPRFYAEARRVLRPGSPLAIWCYGIFTFGDPQIDRLLDNFYHNIVGPFWPQERQLIEEDYRTIHFPLQEISTPHFNMQAEFTMERLAGYLRTWSATQRFEKEKGFDPVAELEQTIASIWPSQSVQSPLRWPIHIRAGYFPSP